MIKLGLTGSIGMGKSTTAQIFAAQGVPCHDADAAVHHLYAGRAIALIEGAFPGCVIGGKVDRNLLGSRVIGKPEEMKRLEAIIHPLVREQEQEFLKKAEAEGRRVVVLDVPLLFETGGDERVHASVVVTASTEIQRQRVLSRPGMTEERFQAILEKQMADAEKRRRAHFLIDTGHGHVSAERAVKTILRAVAAMV